MNQESLAFSDGSVNAKQSLKSYSSYLHGEVRGFRFG